MKAVQLTLAAFIREIDQELRVGQIFFSDVVAEGVLLYDSHRFTLAKPIALTPDQRFELARRNFEAWFMSAGHFWRGAGYYKVCGFFTLSGISTAIGGGTALLRGSSMPSIAARHCLA